MLIAAVLLILAVLLFGSSAVIGVFGAVLGFIAFTAFLGVVAWTFSIDFEYIMFGIILIIAVPVLILQYGFGVDMSPPPKKPKK